MLPDILGDIIRVDDANTYIVKIPPDAKKERIGLFVKSRTNAGIIVGVIKNITNTIREDLIPYIGPEFQSKYAPFNEDFRNSYYLIQGLGKIQDGIVKYYVDSPPDVKDVLEILDHDEIRMFHSQDGKPSIAYFNNNLELLPKNVLLGMLDQVEVEYPDCKAMLKSIRKYIQRQK